MSIQNKIASRKLWFTVFCIATAFGFPIIGAFWIPSLIPLYKEFTGTLIALCAIYLTGNVGSKFVAAKFLGQEDPPAAKKTKKQPVEPVSEE